MDDRLCQLCGLTEETWDCIYAGDDPEMFLAERMTAGRAPHEWETEAMFDHLCATDRLIRRDNGGWMMAAMTDSEWEEAVNFIASISWEGLVVSCLLCDWREELVYSAFRSHEGIEETIVAGFLDSYYEHYETEHFKIPAPYVFKEKR